MKAANDFIKYISTNGIIGDLIAREKYKFVDNVLIANIVEDVIEIVMKIKEKEVL